MPPRVSPRRALVRPEGGAEALGLRRAPRASPRGGQACRSWCSSWLLARRLGYDFDPGSDVVDFYIRYLRRKLDRTGEPSFICTIRGAGYRLEAPGTQGPRAFEGAGSDIAW